MEGTVVYIFVYLLILHTGKDFFSGVPVLFQGCTYIQPNTARYSPVFQPNTAQYSPVQPNTARYRPIHSPVQANTARYRPIQPGTARYFSPIQANTAQYRPIQPGTAQYRPIQPGIYTKVYFHSAHLSDGTAEFRFDS